MTQYNFAYVYLRGTLVFFSIFQKELIYYLMQLIDIIVMIKKSCVALWSTVSYKMLHLLFLIKSFIILIIASLLKNWKKYNSAYLRSFLFLWKNWNIKKLYLSFTFLNLWYLSCVVLKKISNWNYWMIFVTLFKKFFNCICFVIFK